MKFFLLSDLTKFVLSMAMHECYPGWNYVGTKGDHGPLFPKLLIYIYIYLLLKLKILIVWPPKIYYIAPLKKKKILWNLIKVQKL